SKAGHMDASDRKRRKTTVAGRAPSTYGSQGLRRVASLLAPPWDDEARGVSASLEGLQFAMRLLSARTKLLIQAGFLRAPPAELR
ncbi:hypothetical protein, partial [Mesorhizobium sp. M0203]